MNPRERSLALLVGGSLLLIVLFYGWWTYSGMVTAREQQRDKLESDLRKQKGLLRKAQADVTRLHAFQARSLPSDVESARSVYQTWLLEKAQAAGLGGQNTAATSTRPFGTTGQLGTIFTFNAKGEATLPQIVKFLDGISRDNYLHRVTKLSLKPVPNSKQLDVILTIEALALTKADAEKALPEVPKRSLALPDAEAYAAVICGRNVFGPKNKAPGLSSSSSQTATINREFSTTLQAKDPDPLDKVTYKLLSDVPGAALDPQSGRLRWTPKKTGRQEFEIEMRDDGLPAATAKTKLTVNVQDPPPPESPPTPPPKKPGFDNAKYTVLTGVVEVNDEREVWLLIRPTGETLKLKVGEKFEIGTVKGVVADIGEDDFTFKQEDDFRRLLKGGVLEKSEKVTLTSTTPEE